MFNDFHTHAKPCSIHMHNRHDTYIRPWQLSTGLQHSKHENVGRRTTVLLVQLPNSISISIHVASIRTHLPAYWKHIPALIVLNASQVASISSLSLMRHLWAFVALQLSLFQALLRMLLHKHRCCVSECECWHVLASVSANVDTSLRMLTRPFFQASMWHLNFLYVFTIFAKLYSASGLWIARTRPSQASMWHLFFL